MIALTERQRWAFERAYYALIYFDNSQSTDPVKDSRLDREAALEIVNFMTAKINDQGDELSKGAATREADKELLRDQRSSEARSPFVLLGRAQPEAITGTWPLTGPSDFWGRNLPPVSHD